MLVFPNYARNYAGTIDEGLPHELVQELQGSVASC